MGAIFMGKRWRAPTCTARSTRIDGEAPRGDR